MSSHTGSHTWNDIVTTMKGIHGAGDAFRGNVAQIVDTTFHDKEGEAKDRAIAEKGRADVEAMDERFRGHHDARMTGSGTHFGTTHGVSSNGVADVKATGGDMHLHTANHVQTGGVTHERHTGAGTHFAAAKNHAQ